jgi:hypothetical protein
MGARDPIGGGSLGLEGTGLTFPLGSGSFRALCRQELGAQEQRTLCGLPSATDTIKVPRVFMERLTDAVRYAA